MLNFGASKPRVKGGTLGAQGTPGTTPVRTTFLASLAINKYNFSTFLGFASLSILFLYYFANFHSSSSKFSSLTLLGISFLI